MVSSPDSLAWQMALDPFNFCFQRQLSSRYISNESRVFLEEAKHWVMFASRPRISMHLEPALWQYTNQEGSLVAASPSFFLHLPEAAILWHIYSVCFSFVIPSLVIVPPSCNSS